MKNMEYGILEYKFTSMDDIIKSIAHKIMDAKTFDWIVK